MVNEIKNYHSLVRDYFFRGTVPQGEIGIEIEVEGQHLPRAMGSYWDVHNDGSLRGEAVEYVLSKPTKRSNVLPFLVYLKDRLKDSVIHDSIRTSVHVHVNMADKTILQVYIILITYFILENLVIQLAGANRVGNLFCLRITDAEYLLDQLIQAAQRDFYHGLSQESSLRYAAANVCALQKFNSLEFRAKRGTVDPDEINDWVELLLKIVDNSVRYYRTPLEVVQDFSAVGPNAFALKILEDHLEKFKEQDISKFLWSGIRRVQEIAYCTDWTYSDYIPTKILFSKKPTERSPSPPPLLRDLPRTMTFRTNATNQFINNINTPPTRMPENELTALQVIERERQRMRESEENVLGQRDVRLRRNEFGFLEPNNPDEDEPAVLRIDPEEDF